MDGNQSYPTKEGRDAFQSIQRRRLIEKLLTVQQAAETLGLKVSTLYSKVVKKSIPHVKLGTRVLFSPNDLEYWVQQQKIIPAKEP